MQAHHHTEHDLNVALVIAVHADNKAEHFTDVARTLDVQQRTTLATHYYNLADAYEALAAARRREASLQADKRARAEKTLQGFRNTDPARDDVRTLTQQAEAGIAEGAKAWREELNGPTPFTGIIKGYGGSDAYEALAAARRREATQQAQKQARAANVIVGGIVYDPNTIKPITNNKHA